MYVNNWDEAPHKLVQQLEFFMLMTDIDNVDMYIWPSTHASLDCSRMCLIMSTRY